MKHVLSDESLKRLPRGLVPTHGANRLKLDGDPRSYILEREGKLIKLHRVTLTDSPKGWVIETSVAYARDEAHAVEMILGDAGN